MFKVTESGSHLVKKKKKICEANTKSIMMPPEPQNKDFIAEYLPTLPPPPHFSRYQLCSRVYIDQLIVFSTLIIIIIIIIIIK